jgi:lysophospholipase L1-like esterase
VNGLNYFIVSGSLFFAGASVLLVAALLPILFGKKLLAASRAATILGSLAVLFSAAPLPFWLYALWLAAILVSLFATALARLRPGAARWAHLPAVAICAAALCMELPRLPMPEGVIDKPRTTYVVGDSLSAETPGSDRWPCLMGKERHVGVVNLAVPGATACSALAQASWVQGDDGNVVIEIGGNDLLAAAPAAEFERDLERLLQSLRGPRRTLVMLELPLPSFANQYGMVQRRLARQYGVILIPRRMLAGVLFAPGATTDGLHLSPAGQQRMAREMAKLFR